LIILAEMHLADNDAADFLREHSWRGRSATEVLSVGQIAAEIDERILRSTPAGPNGRTITPRAIG
jgi:hypothetical protein